MTGNLARGKALEKFAADMWASKTGKVLVGCPPEGVAHPAHPSIMHGRYDRWIYADSSQYLGIPGEPGILEVKVLGRWTYKQTQDEGIHPEYQCQLQHYLGCTGLKWGAFAVMNPDAWDIIDPGMLVFTRNDEMIQVIEDTVVQWWEEYVVRGVRPPTVDGDEHRWPRALAGQPPVDWSHDPVFNNACLNLHAAREQYDLAKRKKELAEERVKTIMGEVEVAESIHGKITWKEGTRNTFDKAAYLSDNPHVDLSPWIRATVTRTFRPNFT